MKAALQPLTLLSASDLLSSQHGGSDVKTGTPCSLFQAEAFPLSPDSSEPPPPITALTIHLIRAGKDWQLPVWGKRINVVSKGFRVCEMSSTEMREDHHNSFQSTPRLIFIIFFATGESWGKLKSSRLYANMPMCHRCAGQCHIVTSMCALDPEHGEGGMHDVM